MNQKNTALLQTVTVRIVNGSDSTGSGILFWAKERQCVYCITAMHVLYGKAFNSKPINTEVVVDNIHPAGHNRQLGSYRLRDGDKILAARESDIAVIILKETAVESWLKRESGLSVTTDNYDLQKCYLRGFPRYTENTEDRTIAVRFTEASKQDANVLLVSSLENLDTVFSDAAENADGLSGSGLFLEAHEHLYLFGIVTEFTPINSFKAVRAAVINGLLSTNGYPAIPVVEIEPNLLIVESVIKFQQNEKLVRARIRDTVGNIHIRRTGIDALSKLIPDNSLTLIKGDAGVGKSAFTKALIDAVQEGEQQSVFLFTGEQFSHATIDEVFSAELKIEVPFQNIINSPVFSKEKIFWIDSIEKLLETGRIEAFTELLKYAWRIRQN